ncbi:CS1 type fimbrial major subunit [Pseudomonas sp. B22129]|uniref:CS1 type fimbrial major subunit n=1 Tax=Pseudomonas sp. B22129 TaxID=3235111 RepID=UPI003784592B
MDRLFKWVLLCATVGALTLCSMSVFAAVERKRFDLSVSIPTVDFHVLPVNPQVLTHEQVLEWDVRRNDLRPLVADFDVKNSAGAISAYLDSAPTMSNGSATFSLNVRFNGVDLLVQRNNIRTVVTEPAARIGARVPLEIQPVRPANGYEAGTYYGNVRMIFDAVAPR